MGSIEELEAIEEKRSRQTAMIIFGCVALLCAGFLIRALLWDIELRIFSLSVGVATSVASVWMLHRGVSMTPVIVLGLAGMFIAAGVSAYTSGGIHNASLGWVIVIPLLGGLAGGMLTGCVGVLFALLTTAWLFYLDLNMGSPPDLTPIAFQYSQDRLHQFAQILVCGVAMIGFLRQRFQANSLLEIKVRELMDEIDARALAEAETQRANLAKTEFLANMSHEIRTPMHGVQGVLELMQAEQLTENQRDLIDIARRSANNMLQIINEILDISKVESGQLNIEVAPFDLVDLFSDVESSMTLSAHRVGLRLDLKTDFPRRRVKGDMVRLRQVLDNLIGNAIKFTSEGTVRIKASLTEVGNGEGLLRCDVQDSGIGIPEEMQSSIFESFIQADASTTRKFGGTGLGLAISKKLIELMEGQIIVSSEPGEGSCFSFTARLPLGKETESPRSPETERNVRMAVDVGQYRVLLVEDNEINIQLALAMLEDLEFDVDVAENGAEAVTKLVEEGNEYDLVLMDCQMPEMDGYEATRVIRADRRFGGLPIIAMTAHAMKGDREKCLASGMSDYLTKPIDIDSFDATLKSWLERSAT